MTLPDERVRELLSEIARLTRERDQEATIATAWVQRYDRVAAEAKAFCEEKNQAVRERDEARAEVNRCRLDMRSMNAERDRLRALLREVEWKARRDDWPVCPFCEHAMGQGHATDCKLKVALEGHDG